MNIQKAHFYVPVGGDRTLAAKCPFIGLLKKIWEAVKELFQKIHNYFHPKSIDEIRENEMIDRALSRIRPLTNKEPGQLKESPSIKAELLTLSVPVPDIKAAYKNENPVLQQFYETGMDLLDHMGDHLYTHQIEPNLGPVEEGLKKFQETMKRGAHEIIEIGSDIAAPLAKKLNDLKINQNIDGTLAKVLEWILKMRIDQDDLAQFLEKKGEEHLKAHLNRPNLTPEEVRTAHQFIPPMLQWLFVSKAKGKLIDAYPEGLKNEPMIKKILEDCIYYLAEKKVEEFDQRLHSHVNGNLRKVVKKALKTNMAIMGDLVLQRLIDLIQHVDYQNIYDYALKLLTDHTQAIKIAEEARELAVQEAERINAQAKDAHRIPPSSNPANEARRQSLIDLSKLSPEQAAKWVEEEGEKAANESFKQLKICHEQIEQLKLLKEVKEEDIDPLLGNIRTVLNALGESLFQEENDPSKPRHLFENVAGDLIHLIFPDQIVSVNGNQKKVDGLIYAVGQLEIPLEINELFQEGKYIYKEIISDNSQKVIANISHMIMSEYGEKMEKWLMNRIREQLKVSAAKGISLLFETFVIPKEIDQFVLEVGVPAIRIGLVEAIIRKILNENFKKVSSLLTQIYGEREAENANKELLALFKEETRKIVPGNELSDRDIEKGIKALKKELLGFMEDYLRESNPAELDISPRVERALTRYFSKGESSKNFDYADLILNTVFGLGQLNSDAGWWAEALSKGFINKELSNALHDFAKSPEHLIHIITKSLHKEYCSPQGIEKLFKPKESLDPAVSKKQLENELEKISKIAHGFIFKLTGSDQNIIGANNWFTMFINDKIVQPIASSITKKVIDEDPTHLNEVVQRIYRKMFGNRLRTQNLLVIFQEKVTHELQESAKRIQATKAPILMDKMPKLFPEFMTA